MRSYWSSDTTGVLLKRGNLDTGMHTGERHVKMKAAIGVMLLHAKERGKLLGNHQKLGEKYGTDSFLDGTNPADTLILEFSFL